MASPERIVVISPHCDDAVFGCGQLLALRPGALVVTAFAGRPRTAHRLTRWDAAAGFRPGDDVMATRRAEDRQALALLGARPAWLDFCDSQYGCSPTADELARALERGLRAARPGAVFAPLGLFHSDHALVHEAALAIQARHLDLVWFLYADAIYRCVPDLAAERLARLRATGIQLMPVEPAGEPALARKREAVRCYRSQLRALAAPGHPGYDDALEPDGYWRLEP